MKERTIVTAVVLVFVVGILLAVGSTDGIFVALTAGFFLLCIAYAEWCERL